MFHMPDAFRFPSRDDGDDDKLRRRTRSALWLVALLVFGLFGLAAVLQVGGAVVGGGEVAVESSVKTISHPVGGIVAAVLVRDGDHVAKGQELMRFDTSVSRVGSASASTGLGQLLARRARLQAERDGARTILFPPELTRSTDPEVRDAMERERRTFSLKRDQRDGMHSILTERIHQYEQEIAGYQVQITAVEEQSRLIKPELEGLRKLYAKQLVTLNRINELERTAVQLDGTRAALGSSIAGSRAKISEMHEQMFNVDKTARSDAATELAEVNGQINDQQVRAASATDTYTRSVIRAPQSGTIDKIAYTTIGSAVPPAQPIMQIVPDRDSLIVEGRVRPQDVDQLRVGQPARVTFSGFDRQTTPDIPGTLEFVSAELAQDQHSGASFYRIKVRLDPVALVHAPQIVLKAGMPAEVFIKTGDRSILSFLVKPMLDQMRHAFRDG